MKCPFKNIPFNIGLISNWLQSTYLNDVTVQTAPGNVYHFGGKKKKGVDGATVSYKLRELVKTADCNWQTGANKKQSDRGISEDMNKKTH